MAETFRESGDAQWHATVDAQPPTIDHTVSPADFPIFSGKTFGDYELIEEIARGGMGVVFRARQVSLDRVVALKMILKGGFASDIDVAKFRAEAESAARLDHPHIVPIHEIGEVTGQHYYTMKFIDGGSLAGRKLEPHRDTVKQMVLICRAVHFAHQRGLLHRDLKPGNILVDAAGAPYVADFGLAKRVEGDSAVSHTGTVVGTPGYMAPEQARGDKVLTTAADVWSLGALLYDRLTGRPPFHADTPMVALRQVIDAEPPSPRSINQAIDRDLETVVLKCLEKDSSKRYPSADALADDLDRWHRGEPIQARPVGPVQRTIRWIKRKPAQAALAAAPFALLIAWGVGATQSAQKQARLREEQELLATKLQKEQEKTAEALEKAESALATNRITLAQQYLQNRNVSRAQSMLGEVPGRHRDWEWDFLFGQSHSEEAVLRFPGRVVTAQFNRDGQRLMTLDRDKIAVVTIWNWPERKALVRLRVEPSDNASPAAAIHPNGTIFATGDAKGRIRLWDATTGAHLRDVGILTAELAGASTSLAIAQLGFSPDGTTIAACSSFKVAVWDLSNRKQVYASSALTAKPGKHPFFSPDGKRFAFLSNTISMNLSMTPTSVRSDYRVEVYDTKTWKQVGDIPQETSSVVGCADWLDRGERIVSASGARKDGRSVTAYDIATFRSVRSWQTADPINVLCVSADRARFASASRGAPNQVTIFDASTNTTLRNYLGHTGQINCLAMHPTEPTVISGADDRSMRIWNLKRSEQPRRVKTWTPDDPFTATFAANGSKIVWGVPATQRLSVGEIGRANESSFIHVDRPLYPAQFDVAATGRRIVINEGPQASIYDMIAQKRLVRPINEGETVSNLALDREGNRLATVTVQQLNGHQWKSILRISDLNSKGPPIEARAFDGIINPLAFSSDGRWIAGAGPKDIVAWDATNGEEKWRHTALIGSPIMAFGISPSGHHVAAATHVGVHLIDAGKDTTPRLLVGHNEQVKAMAFHPRDTRLATADSSTIKFWDVMSGQEVFTLRMPDASPDGAKALRSPLAMTFTPDGHSLLVAMSDGSVFSWDAPTPGETREVVIPEFEKSESPERKVIRRAVTSAVP